MKALFYTCFWVSHALFGFKTGVKHAERMVPARFRASKSFSFLPVMVIAPQKFALLFAFGSMTMLGSFTLLMGPKAFLQGMARKEQLPFSVAYSVGLIGTLVATLILRSFLLTGICGLLQAVGLLYFVASYVPGGKAGREVSPS